MKKPQKGDTLLFFYNGHDIEQTGSAHLVPIDAVVGQPETLVRASTVGSFLGQCKADVKFLILDCYRLGNSAGPASEQVGRGIGGQGPRTTDGAAAKRDAGPFLGTQIRSKDLRQCVVLESCKGNELSYEWPEKQRGVFTYWLCRGLEGAADTDGDGRVSADEVYEYTLNRVQRTISQVHPGARQTPTREIDTPVTGDSALLILKPERPEEICRRLAVHLDDEVRLQGIKTVAVAGEFRVKTTGGASQLGSFPLPRYLADQIRNELGVRANDGHKYQVSADPSIVTTAEVAGAPAVAQCGPAGAGPDATVFGELSLLDRGIGLQCELFAEGGTVVKPSGLIPLDADRGADLGQSFDLTRRARRSSEQAKNIGAWIEEAREAHPLLDHKSSFHMEIHRFLGMDSKTGLPLYDEEPEKPTISPKPPWDGTDLEADPRKLLVPAEPDERFMIRLYNRTDKRVGVTLLVDGINTLGKRPELAGMGGVWIMEAQSQIDVQGWFGGATRGDKPGTVEVESSWFVFTDIAQSLAQRLNSTEKVGLITAVFYEEAKGRGLRHGAPIAGGTRQSSRSSRSCGEICLATISLGYADARELRQFAKR